jgi:hypothetical protein
MTEGLFGYADVGRTGLAHSLLAWARCVVWAEQVGATMLAPHWFRFRIGPMIRQERDKRHYFADFHDATQVSGLRREYLLATSMRVHAELDLPGRGNGNWRKTVVIFRNAQAVNGKKFFHLIEGHHELVRDRLISITTDKALAGVHVEPHVAIHVRRGDFKEPDTGDLDQVVTNTRLPIEWYEKTFLKLRSQIGYNFKTIIYSDGSDAEIAELLKYKNVERSKSQSAITDLISMSNAAVIVASVSGFSQWGSYLGNVPCISYPSQSLFSYLKCSPTEIEVSIENDIPSDFLIEVKSRL